jgi:hypothetical protein
MRQAIQREIAVSWLIILTVGLALAVPLLVLAIALAALIWGDDAQEK